MTAYDRCIHLYNELNQLHFELLLLAYGAYLTFFQFCQAAFPDMGHADDDADDRRLRHDDVPPRRRAEGARRGGDRARRRRRVRRRALGRGDARRARGERRRPGVGRRPRVAQAPVVLSCRPATASTTTTAPGRTTCGCRSRRSSATSRSSAPEPSLDRPQRAAARRAGSDRRRVPRAPRHRRGAGAVRGDARASAATSSRTRRAHKFFIEHWGTSLFFNKMREIGAVLAEHGFFEEADDVFYLNIHEVHEALSDLGLAWSGGSAGARHRLLAAAGRAAQGDPGDAGRVDAAARARRRARGDHRPDRPAALGRHRRPAARLGERVGRRGGVSGYAASPGVAEGLARVVRDVERDRRRCSRARCSSAP